MPKQCHHINAQSVFAGPWSMCFDCRVRHVRAAMDRFDGGVRITAGLGTILRALAETPEIEVAAQGIPPLTLRQAADGSLIGEMEGQAIAVHLGSTR